MTFTTPFAPWTSILMNLFSFSKTLMHALSPDETWKIVLDGTIWLKLVLTWNKKFAKSRNFRRKIEIGAKNRLFYRSPKYHDMVSMVNQKFLGYKWNGLLRRCYSYVLQQESCYWLLRNKQPIEFGAQIWPTQFINRKNT